MENFSTSQGKAIYLDGRKVASVRDNVLRRSLHGSRHLLKDPARISFAHSVLEDARRAGAQAIEVKDVETGIRYQISLMTFFARGKRFEPKGWPVQVACELVYWQALEPSRRTGQRQPEQLTLWR